MLHYVSDIAVIKIYTDGNKFEFWSLWGLYHVAIKLAIFIKHEASVMLMD